jgi:hypothetical protein
MLHNMLLSPFNKFETTRYQDAIPPYILVMPGDFGGSLNGLSACLWFRLRCERDRVWFRVAVGI